MKQTLKRIQMSHLMFFIDLSHHTVYGFNMAITEHAGNLPVLVAIGNHTEMDTGYGQTMAGPGCQIILGVGHLFIMVDG